MITLPLSFQFHLKYIDIELVFLKEISLLHPWVTCLPGCNRKTGAFICLYFDYSAMKFSTSLKICMYIELVFLKAISLLHPYIG